MLASETSIVFPALLLHENEDDYGELLGPDDLFVQPRAEEPWLLNGEIIDSSGQRFVIRAIADVRPVDTTSETPRWKRWLGLKGRPRYRFDFALEALGVEAFEETFRRVAEKEAAQEAYHLIEGGGADTPEDKARFQQCRSIADIIAACNASSR